MNEKTLLAAVDIGGSNVRCALAHADRPLDFLAHRSAPTPAASAPSPFVDFLFDQINSCLAEANHDCAALAGLGCTAPGITDAGRGVVISAANLSDWTNVPLAELLRAKFGIPVAVENDVNAAALGEREFGAGRGADSLIYLTISTGVAAGIIVGGKLLRGFHQCAGEIGFILSEPAQIGRDWGHNGALELTAGGIGMARQWQAVKAGRENATAVDVFRAARAGDAAAAAIVARAGDYLAQSAVALCTAIDPEVLVLGGSIVINEEDIFRRIESVVTETLPHAAPRVGLAELGGDSPLVGALALAKFKAD